MFYYKGLYYWRKEMIDTNILHYTPISSDALYFNNICCNGLVYRKLLPLEQVELFFGPTEFLMLPKNRTYIFYFFRPLILEF